MTSILNVESRIDGVLDSLRHRLDEEAVNDRAFDISTWINYFTFNAISELACGTAFGCLETGNDVHGILAGLQSGFLLPVLFSTFPGFFNPLFAIVGHFAKPPADSGIGLAIKVRRESQNSIGRNQISNAGNGK
jgi:hypothetical protein